jgi:hypothetical protein
MINRLIVSRKLSQQVQCSGRTFVKVGDAVPVNYMKGKLQTVRYICHLGVIV